MPQTNLTGPYGNVTVERIGIHPVYTEDSFTTKFQVSTNANQEPPQEFLDANRCDIPDFMGYGWAIDCLVYVDGQLVSSDGYCTPHRPTVDAPTTHDIYVPFNVSQGEHTVRFEFRYSNGSQDVIGEEIYEIDSMDPLSNAEWEEIGKETNHEEGDIIETQTWLDSDAPLPRLAFELRADVLGLQKRINAELPGNERIIVLDTELVEADHPDHDYRYRMVYFVDHASPIAATTVIMALGLAIAAVLVAYFINESLINARKLTSNPAGAAALNIWGLAALGGIGYLISKETGLLDKSG
jgi:hypothetical protein